MAFQGWCACRCEPQETTITQNNYNLIVETGNDHVPTVKLVIWHEN